MCLLAAVGDGCWQSDVVTVCVVVVGGGKQQQQMCPCLLWWCTTVPSSLEKGESAIVRSRIGSQYNKGGCAKLR